MTSISSQSELLNPVESEIQKMLKLIQNDVLKIKRELSGINEIVKDDGPLSSAIKNSTDKLLNTAAKNGIDVENLMASEFDLTAADQSIRNRITSLELTERIKQFSEK